MAQIVVSFYRDVLRSNRLGHFFQDVSMSQLVDHQTLFMETVMGGPLVVTEEHILAAHEHLHVTDEDFDAMLGLLETSLLRFGVSSEDTTEMPAGYRKLQRHVVHQPRAVDGDPRQRGLGEAPKIADLLAFLGSDAASFCTGGYYLADGAYTAQ